MSYHVWRKTWNNYCNIVNYEQDEPIQEDQEKIEIQWVNKSSDTESTASNVRISEREINSVEILEHTIKVQIYIQTPKVKNTDKQAKKEPAIKFWDETIKNRTQKGYIHNMVSQTDEKI